MKKEIKFDSHDIIEVIKNIEYLRTNLARIGRVEIKNDDDFDNYLYIQNLFIIESEMYKRLTSIRKVLMNNFQEEEDELDDLLEESVSNWSIPSNPKSNEIKSKISNLLDLE